MAKKRKEKEEKNNTIYEENDTVEIYAKVKMKAEEYQRYKSGEIRSNKGLRADDGKISSIPDFEEVDDYKHYNYINNDIDDYGNNYDYGYDSYSDGYSHNKEYEMSPAMEKLCDIVAEILADATFKFGEKIIDYIKPRFAKLKNKNKDKKKYKSIKKRKYTQIYSDNNALMSSVDILDSFSEELDIVNTKYESDGLDEESKKHLVNIFALAVQIAYEIKAFSESVVDNNVLKKYNKDIEIIVQEKTIKSINTILNKDISFLENDYTNKLSKILGYDIINNGNFVSFDSENIKEKLLIE